MVAARNDNPAIIPALARYGSPANALDGEHQTALFYAHSADTVKALVACGVNLNTRNRNGWTALDENLRYATQLPDALLDQGASDSNALLLAAQYSSAHVLRRMIRLDWKFDALDEDGQTPLMRAMCLPNPYRNHWNLETVLLLIRSGANVNVHDKLGDTPLMIACEGGWELEMDTQSLRVINALLERGARINCPNNDGQTPLMVAATHLRPVLVRLLLQHGAQVNVRTKKGKTALSLARHSEVDADGKASRSEVVRLLKNAGAKE